MKTTYPKFFSDLRRRDDVPEGSPDFFRYLHNDPLVILHNLERQAKEKLDTELEDYLIKPVSDLLAQISEARTALEKSEHQLFAWRMFYIGSAATALDFQEFMQDGGVSLAGKTKKAKKQQDRKKKAFALYKAYRSDGEKLSATVKKIINLMVTYDFEEGLTKIYGIVTDESGKRIPKDKKQYQLCIAKQIREEMKRIGNSAARTSEQ